MGFWMVYGLGVAGFVSGGGWLGWFVGHHGGSYVVVVAELWQWLCCGFEWLVDMGLSSHWRVMVVSGCGFKWLVE